MGLFQFTHWWSDLQLFLVKRSQTPLFYPKCPQLVSLSFPLDFALSYIYTNNDKTGCSTELFSIQLIYSKILRELSEIWDMRKTERAGSYLCHLWLLEEFLSRNKGRVRARSVWSSTLWWWWPASSGAQGRPEAWASTLQGVFWIFFYFWVISES